MGGDRSAEGGTREGRVRGTLGPIGFIARLAPMPPYCALSSILSPPSTSPSSPAAPSVLCLGRGAWRPATHTSMRTCLASTVECSGRPVASPPGIPFGDHSSTTTEAAYRHRLLQFSDTASNLVYSDAGHEGGYRYCYPASPRRSTNTARKKVPPRRGARAKRTSSCSSVDMLVARCARRPSLLRPCVALRPCVPLRRYCTPAPPAPPLVERQVSPALLDESLRGVGQVVF